MKKPTLIRLVALVAAMLCTLGASAADEYAYACYTSDNTTLTFYYDNQFTTRPGTTYRLYSGEDVPDWYDIRTSVTHVEFDPSFADATPRGAHYWFYEMSNLQSVTGIEYLNTSNMTDMNGMFAYCSSLTSLDVSHFDTSKSTDMGGLFYGCSGLNVIDVSHFNTAKVTNMYGMFYGCSGLTMLDLGSFNVVKVTEMQYMFYHCSNLVTIYVGGGWYQDASVSSANQQNMFTGCTSIVGGQGTTYNSWHVNGDYSGPDDPSNGYPGYMTEKCYAVYTSDNNTLTFYFDYQRSSRQGTKYDMVWYSQNQPWYLDATYKSVKQVVFDPSFAEVRSTSTDYWFRGMNQLQSVMGLEYLNTEDVTSMRLMFYECSHLTTLDLSGFNTAKVKNLNKMFYCCSNLTTIYVGEEWSMAAVTSANNANEMFTGCISIVGGMGTTYDENHTDAEYAHIDGGTADPGYFTEVPEPEPYACYTAENTTLTFYYDSWRGNRGGTTYDLNTSTNDPGWYTDGTCSSVTSVVFDPSFADARPTTAYRWFYSMKNLQTITGMKEYLNTEEVTNMYGMFYYCNSLTSLDLSNFNTAKVTSMESMFNSCTGLTSLDLSSFNTEKVINMQYMFFSCSDLISLNLSSFNTKKVLNMLGLFSFCQKLTSLDLSNFNTSKVTNMGMMFNGCWGLTSLDLSNFNTSYVTNMSSMFEGCKGLTSLDLSSFNTTNVKDMSFMFKFCTSLTSLDLSSFNTANVTNMSYMFNGCTGLTSLDLSSFNTAKVVQMQSMFNECTGLTSLDLSSFNTAKAVQMQYMFYRCISLGTIYVDDEWSTATASLSNDMFLYCTSLVGGQGTTYDADHVDKAYAHIDGGPSNPGYLTEWKEPYACYTSDNTTLTFYYDSQRDSRPGTTYDLNIGGNNPDWVVDETNSSVTQVVFDQSFADARPTSTYCWFFLMENLQSITGIENLNTEEATKMGAMFMFCSALTSLDVSNFNTAKTTDMFHMFYGCNSLTSLDVSGFNTAIVDDMRGMFRNCSGLTTLDLSNFNTALVSNMSSLFKGCSNLATIYAGDEWSTTNLNYSSEMFSGCTSLVGGQGTTYDADHIDAEYAHIDGGPSNPGYLTAAGLIGDVTGDNVVNIADVTALIDCLLSGTTPPAGADCNGDGTVNIADVTTLIDYLLGGQWP